VNIAIVCYPTHGGSGVIASELALGLAERGHHIHIVSYAIPFRLRCFHHSVVVHEVEVATYPLFKYPPYALALAAKLVEIAQKDGLDLVHTHYAVPHATSAFLAREMLKQEHPIKTVTTLHGTDITLTGLDRSFYQVVKFSIEQADSVTAVSRYLRDQTHALFNIDREIHTIFNFVDTERFQRGQSECTREYFAGPDEKVIIHASNFRPVKRVVDVVRVFAKIRESIPARLLMVGEGPERLPAQELVEELGLTDQVFFLGEQDYIERLLSCSDLLLLPSEEESFGLVALEALSCSVPVIGTAIGGLPEVVEDGVNGFLCPVGAIDEMAEKAIWLLTDESRFEAFRQNARTRALQFDSKNIVGQYERLYQNILEVQRV